MTKFTTNDIDEFHNSLCDDNMKYTNDEINLVLSHMTAQIVEMSKKVGDEKDEGEIT